MNEKCIRIYLKESQLKECCRKSSLSLNCTVQTTGDTSISEQINQSMILINSSNQSIISPYPEISIEHFCVFCTFLDICFKSLFSPGLAVQCLSVGVGVKHSNELSRERKEAKDDSVKDLNEKKRRQARQAEDHSGGDPLDF